MELAKLIRYEHVTATLDDPQMAKADALLAAEDADVQKTDFTLKDLNNKKVTLSELKGKIVLVNFWATWWPALPQGDAGPRTRSINTSSRRGWSSFRFRTRTQ